MIYMATHFTHKMLRDGTWTVQFQAVSHKQVIELVNEQRWQSVIGHKASAQVATQELGVRVSVHRRSIKVSSGDTVIILSIRLPRLKEGTYLNAEQIREAGVDWHIATVTKGSTQWKSQSPAMG